MRKFLRKLVLLLTFALPGIGATEIPTSWTPELSMEVRTIGEVVPSEDGQWVAYTETRSVIEKEKSEMLTHIFLARTDGSRRFQLTAGEQSCDSPSFSPDGRFVYFTSGRSSPEKRKNIWRISVSGGEAQRLTDWKGSLSGYRVSPDGKWIAFTGREADPEDEKAKKEKRDFRVVDGDPKNASLWVLPAEPNISGERPVRRVFEAARHVAEIEWSPDSRRIVFEHWPGNKPDDSFEADLSEAEIESGKVKVLAGTEFREASPRYSADGKWLAYVQSSELKRWAGEGRLTLLDLKGGEKRALPVTHDEFGRGSNLLGFSSDTGRLYFTETAGTANVLRAVNIDGNSAPRTLYQPSQGTLSGYGRGSRLNVMGTAIGFVQESATEAPEAYVLKASHSTPVKMSQSNSGLPKLPLGRTELIRWKSNDGLEIEGLLTYPAGYEPGRKVPLALVIHGGPMGVFTDTFIAAPGLYPVASFAAKGYAVLRPNPRGSSGYGKKFRMANYGDWGGGDYQDIMSGVDHVIAQGVADPDRLAVMGWSYGGFMTSWIITQTDRFKAAGVGAAVTNLWSFTGTADIPGFLPDYFHGEPWENFEAYRDHSPMSFVKGVRTPALILHGEEDVRVPISQGYELYNALKRQGVTVKMVVYPRTPHGPREPKFLLDVAQRHLEWTEKYVK